MGVYEDMAHDAGYRGDEAKQMAQAIEQDHMRQAMEHQEQEPDQIDMMDDADVRKQLRETLVALGLKDETIQAMESVLAKIGEHLNVAPGDVPGLLDALGQLTAENKRMEDAGNHLLKAGCDKDNQIFEHQKRIEQLEAVLKEWLESEDWDFRPVYDGLVEKSRQLLAGDTGQ